MYKVFETPQSGHFFCGYYDKSPFNYNNRILLACRSSFIDRPVNSKDILEIGYFDLNNSREFIKVSSTCAWNWQQGCMLQWVLKGIDNEIIFNDRIENQFVTVKLNIKTMERTIFPMAHYAMDVDATTLLCIDNERHFFFRPNYSYQGIENELKNQAILKTDGIWKIDVKERTVKQIITLDQLLQFKPLTNMKGSVHYVEH